MKDKENLNSFLMDKNFINSVYFEDKYYFQEVCKEVRYFIEHCPLPVITEWDENKSRIWIKIGGYKKYVQLNTDVPPKEALRIVEKDMIKDFYPKYKYIEEVPFIDLPKEEVLSDIRRGLVTFDEHFNKVKKKDIYGVITKIYLPRNEFFLWENDQTVVRQSNFMLKDFLNGLRDTSFGKDRRDYILDNSKKLNDVPEIPDGTIEIKHSGEKMYNFVKVRIDEQRGCALVETDNKMICIWGKYKLFFDSVYTMEKCKAYIDDNKNVENKIPEEIKSLI